MINKLFVICPFSCMESFLNEKYGNDIYFLTHSAAVLKYLDQDFEYISELKQFAIREEIKIIYIVNDTSCRFINEILMRNKTLEFQAIKILEDLYLENYVSKFEGQPLFQQQINLAELNIKNQLYEIKKSLLFQNNFSEFDIEIKGLITTKEKGGVKKFN